MMAKRLAHMLAGTCVMIAADLVVKRWKTKDGVRHQKLELHATRITG